MNSLLQPFHSGLSLLSLPWLLPPLPRGLTHTSQAVWHPLPPPAARGLGQRPVPAVKFGSGVEKPPLPHSQCSALSGAHCRMGPARGKTQEHKEHPAGVTHHQTHPEVWPWHHVRDNAPREPQNSRDLSAQLLQCKTKTKLSNKQTSLYPCNSDKYEPSAGTEPPEFSANGTGAAPRTPLTSEPPATRDQKIHRVEKEQRNPLEMTFSF